MTRFPGVKLFLEATVWVCWAGGSLWAVDDGHADLIAREPALTGTGVDIAQVEALNNDTPKRFEADHNQTNASVTYFDDADPYPTGRTDPANTNPDRFSNHANSVADEIYDTLLGFAPDISSVQNFELFYHVNNLIIGMVDSGVSTVNQSVSFSAGSDTDAILELYDDYADRFDVLFLNGINTNVNPATLLLPALAYNGLSVGSLSFPVTAPADGRNKPDLAALTYSSSDKSSFTTARVTAFAAILHQAGTRGDQASGSTAEATNAKTKKALLINGAVKPDGWAKRIDYDDDPLPVSHTSPLDKDVGAGVANINEAHLQLEGGLQLPTVETSGSQIPSVSEPDNIGVRRGWNLDTLDTGLVFTDDAVHHYYFDWVPGEGPAFDLTASITWNRQDGESGINNLDLVLYEIDGTAVLVAESVSTVDNVEHLHVEDIPSGRYALTVVSRDSDRVARTEEYALAFNLEAVDPPAAPTDLLATVVSDTEIDLGWADNATEEDGYVLERSTQSDFSVIDASFNLAADVTSFPDVGLTPGVVYYYRLKAFNAGGDSGTVTVNATTWTGREQWRFDNFGTILNTGDAADGENPDGDDGDNLTEYAVGTDPNEVGESVASRIGVDFHTDGGEDYLMIRITRDQKRSDVQYQVRSSGAPASGFSDQTVTVVTDTDTVLEVRDNTPVDSADRRFMDFQVTSSP